VKQRENKVIMANLCWLTKTRWERTKIS